MPATVGRSTNASHGRGSGQVRSARGIWKQKSAARKGVTRRGGQTHMHGFSTRLAKDRLAEDTPASPPMLPCSAGPATSAAIADAIFLPLTFPKVRRRRGRHSRGSGVRARVVGDKAVEKARRVLVLCCRNSHTGSEAAAMAAKTASRRGHATPLPGRWRGGSEAASAHARVCAAGPPPPPAPGRIWKQDTRGPGNSKVLARKRGEKVKKRTQDD